MLRRILIIFSLVATYLVVAQGPAQADFVYCPPDNGPCIIVVVGPGGGPGGPGGGGIGNDGKALCIHERLGQVRCYREGFGWFSYRDACYYLRLTLDPEDPGWGGHNPAEGDMYLKTCYQGGSGSWVGEGMVFLTSEPQGYGGQPDILILATRAIGEIPLDPPALGTAPSSQAAGGSGLVGLPVWMWVNDNPRNWGPGSGDESAGGFRAVATANVVRMEWDMGDGSPIVPCQKGTRYNTTERDNPSPNCGHKYLEPSRTKPGGVYTVTGTAKWEIPWRVFRTSDPGTTIASGTYRVDRVTTTSLQINELQVVVR